MVDAGVETAQRRRRLGGAHRRETSLDARGERFVLLRDPVTRALDQRLERRCPLLDLRRHRENPAPARSCAREVAAALAELRHPHRRHEMTLVECQGAVERRLLPRLVALLAVNPCHVHPQIGRGRVGGDRAADQRGGLGEAPLRQRVQPNRVERQRMFAVRDRLAKQRRRRLGMAGAALLDRGGD